MTFWEQVGTHTSWGRYISSLEAEAISLAGELARGPRMVLDVGCDGGRWVEPFGAQGWDITCTDVSSDALVRCARRVPGARCVAVEPTDRSLPVGDGSVSLLLCIEVLPVVHSDWFAAEAARVLSPGGILVTLVWNRRSARGLVATGVNRACRGAVHPFYRTPYSTWRRRLTGVGFELLAERGLCWFPFGRTSNSPLVPAAARIESGLGLSRLPRLSPWVLVTARKQGPC